MSNNIAGIVEPTVLVTPGPDYAEEVNTSLQAIDNHNHSPNNGLQVPFGGINSGVLVTDTTDFGNNYVSNVKAVSLADQSADPGPINIYTKQISAISELFWEDSNGAVTQITSNGHIQPNGSGSDNGFYGDYAADAASAAYFNATKTFGFFQDLTNSTVANGLFNTLYLQTAATGLNLYMATAGGATPTGGWALGNATAGFQLRLDAATPNSYGNYAFIIKPDGGALNQYFFGLNQTSATTPANPLDVYYLQTGSTVPVNTFRLGLANSTGGAVSVGYGPRAIFAANTNSSAHAISDLVTQGAMEGFWFNVGSQYAGLRLRGAASGTLTGTAAIEIADATGGPIMGFGGAAQTTQLATYYGNIVPDATNSHSLGIAAAAWSAVYTRLVQSDNDLSLAAPAGKVIFLSPNNGAGGQTSSLGDILPATTGTYNLGVSNLRWRGGYFGSGAATASLNDAVFAASPNYVPTVPLDLTARHAFNNIVMTANITVSGTTPTLQANSWNAGTPTRTSLGNYNIPVVVDIDTNAIILCNVQQGAGAGDICISLKNNGTSVDVRLTDPVALAGADVSFYVVVIGGPAVTP